MVNKVKVMKGKKHVHILLVLGIFYLFWIIHLNLKTYPISTCASGLSWNSNQHLPSHSDAAIRGTFQGFTRVKIDGKWVDRIELTVALLGAMVAVGGCHFLPQWPLVIILGLSSFWDFKKWEWQMRMPIIVCFSPSNSIPKFRLENLLLITIHGNF